MLFRGSNDDCSNIEGLNSVQTLTNCPDNKYMVTLEPTQLAPQTTYPQINKALASKSDIGHL